MKRYMHDEDLILITNNTKNAKSEKASKVEKELKALVKVSYSKKNVLGKRPTKNESIVLFNNTFRMRILKLLFTFFIFGYFLVK